MDGLVLVRPSRDMQQALWAYRTELLAHGEARINGSCGLAFFDDFEEWLAVATFMVKEQVSREGVHASTFFLIRVKDEKVLGSVQIRHSLTPELLLHGGHIGYAIRAHRARQELWQAPVDARVGGSKEAGSAAGYDIL